MNFLPFMLAALITVSDPIATDFTKVPESVLNNGLTTLSVCIATDMVGIRKLAELAELIKAEPPPNATEQAKNIKDSAEALLEAMMAEANVGSTIVQALQDKYHYKEADLLKTVKNIIAEAKVDVEAAVGDIIAFDELDDKLGPKVENCDKSLVSWSTELKKYIVPLENQK
jgi:siderophore synthetase component